MNVCFSPYTYDAARGAWTIASLVNQDPDAFALCLANANAAHLLDAMGIMPEPLPIELISVLVTRTLRSRLGKRSPNIPSVIDTQPGTMTLIRCGRRDGYLEERLRDLARLIQHCRTIGATHLRWN